MTFRRFLLGTFIGLAVLGIVFWADIFTGPNIFLGQLYIVAVLTAAWVGGRWSGHLLGAATTAAWLAAFVFEYEARFNVPPADLIWNIVIRFAFYVGVVEVVALLQGVERRLQRVVLERTAELRSEVVDAPACRGIAAEAGCPAFRRRGRRAPPCGI